MNLHAVCRFIACTQGIGELSGELTESRFKFVRRLDELLFPFFEVAARSLDYRFWRTDAANVALSD
jgi:hypothetical protein